MHDSKQPVRRTYKSTYVEYIKQRDSLHLAMLLTYLLKLLEILMSHENLASTSIALSANYLINN